MAFPPLMTIGMTSFAYGTFAFISSAVRSEFFRESESVCAALEGPFEIFPGMTAMVVAPAH